MSTQTLPRALARPLTRDDLHLAPDGWRVGPPDFVGVGCGKSGSSWWYDLLLQHPAIVPNRVAQKELHHFSHFDFRGPTPEDIQVYRELFAAPPGAICGEFTGNYLYHPLALSYLAQAAPQTKLIALLRNPIDRCVSSFNMFATKRAKFFGLDPDREQALLSFSLFPEAMRSARVADGFRQIERLFDPQQVLVLQYERCAQKPLRELRRCLSFLERDTAWVPADARRRVNQQPYVVQKPDAAGRRLLADYFRDDVLELFERFPTLDPALWPDFAS